MDEAKKQRLAYLQERQRQIWHERAILQEKTEFQKSIPDFGKHYVFANAEQNDNVNTFLDRLPALTPTRPDFQNLEKQEMSYIDMKNEKSQVFICFLHGMYVSSDLFCMGELQQVCKDMEYWQDFCSDLILLWNNFRDFIYINGDKMPIKSRL